jgi:pimeloyl-ACP methyl ester carboxylesterase
MVQEAYPNGRLCVKAALLREAADHMTRPVFRLLTTCLLALLVACAPPVSVVRMGPREVARELTANVLTTGKPSSVTRTVLQRRMLGEQFDDKPDAAIAELQRLATGPTGTPNDFFALAELSFLRAEEEDSREWHLAAAVYVLAFLSPETSTVLDDATDPRARVACDLYNRSLAEGLAGSHDRYVVPAASTSTTPFGTLEITFDESQLVSGDRRLVNFLPAADYAVRGLANRHRQPGLGAPLAAQTRPLDQHSPMARWVGPAVHLPITALLRIDAPRAQIASGTVRGQLELHLATDEHSTTLFGRVVPLELELTSSLAASLAEANLWRRELRGFFGLSETGLPVPWLGGLEPYRPGRIPVVFVHGTASSAARWAEMVNELESDPVLYGHFQFWFFMYDTGNPISYSGYLLRNALTHAVHAFDPDGRDPALRQMVVIGHSQGGLLTKLTAVDTGDRLWVGDKPFDELEFDDAEQRELMRETLFVKPLPFVRRVVFLATPHRGSFVAAGTIARWVARWARRPVALVRLVSSKAVGQLLQAAGQTDLPTAVDNMAPENKFVKALSETPLAPGVAANSIVAVETEGPIESGNDGVVMYTSAHRDDVESEIVVKSYHSVQDNPLAIAEVQRILRKHLEHFEPQEVLPVPPGEQDEGIQ